MALSSCHFMTFLIFYLWLWPGHLTEDELVRRRRDWSLGDCKIAERRLNQIACRYQWWLHMGYQIGNKCESRRNLLSLPQWQPLVPRLLPTLWSSLQPPLRTWLAIFLAALGRWDQVPIRQKAMGLWLVLKVRQVHGVCCQISSIYQRNWVTMHY